MILLFQKNLLAAEEEDCDCAKTCKCCKCSETWGFWLSWLIWGVRSVCAFNDVDGDGFLVDTVDCNGERVLVNV